VELNYKRCKRRPLRELGYDETWLQKLIQADPAILGLGENVVVVERERAQPTGGRIDFVLTDHEEEIRYEVELMLGPVDPSHIIRSIEYWDVERTRFPKREHRAVIVAEEITSRFFNVISILNRAVPIIAIQLEALEVDQSFTLHFTKVLDISELYGEEERVSGGEADRKEWENKVPPERMGLLDKLIKLVPDANGAKHVTYNQSHIAVGTSGRNFAWFHVRKDGWFAEFLMDTDQRADWIAKLTQRGILADSRDSAIRIRPLTDKALTENESLFRELLAQCEELSR